MVCQITDVSGARGRNPGLHRSIWFLATFYAVEEISHVIDSTVAVAVLGENGILVPGHIFTMNSKSATIDLQRRLRAAELQSATIDRGIHHSFVEDIKPRVPE